MKTLHAKAEVRLTAETQYCITSVEQHQAAT